MSESFVIGIANGNTVRNKLAITLNKAGDGPGNPILRGLGMAIDQVFTPSVISFESFLGATTPPEDRLLVFESVDDYHYRLRAAAGYGDLMVDGDYSSAIAHYFSLSMVGPSHVVGEERLFWVEEDPLIELGFCAGSSIQSAWLARASESYFRNDVSDTYGLAFDPGEPEVQGVASAATAGSPWYVKAGPDNVLEFAVYDQQQVYPLTVPIRFMNNWLDEFNQHHYGGAKYVSIFEKGLAEDAEGTYVTNVYQKDIDEVTSVNVKVGDVDHEYALIVRFRSELDDSYYVDKEIRFRILTADILNRPFSDDVFESDMPDVSYNAVSGEYKWDGMAAAVIALGITSATAINGDRVVSLPTDDATAFPSGWLAFQTLSYGGEIVVRFQRPGLPGVTIEDIHEVYLVTVSPTTSVDKSLFRRAVHSAKATYVPDTKFRFLEPTTGSVYLEAINNQAIYQQVTVFTDKGSVNVPLPLRNGQIINITSIIDIEAVTGIMQQTLVNVMLATRTTTKIVGVEPVPPQFRLVSRYPDVGIVAGTLLPTSLYGDYPDVKYEFPAALSTGDSYAFAGGENGAGWGATVLLSGRKGMWREVGTVAGGGLNTIVNGLSKINFTNTGSFFFSYRIQVTSGPDTGVFVDYLIEAPHGAGYTGTPPTGLHPGAVQVILYEDKIVIVSKPPNVSSITLKGNISTGIFGPAWLMDQQWYDMSAVVDGAHPSIELTYVTTDYSVDPPVNTTHGPYTVPRFTPQETFVPLVEFANNGSRWDGADLTLVPYTVPAAKISHIDKTISFDYEDRYTEYIRWSVINPLDGTQLSTNTEPLNRTAVDISRLFRSDVKFQLEPGRRVLVMFLHIDGPQIPALYEITGEYVEPEQLNNLRGTL